MYLCFEISLLTIILIITIFVLFFWGVYSVRKYKNKKNNNIEHFASTTMTCLIQADDECWVYYKNGLVAHTSNWNVATSFTINNPVPGDKMWIHAENRAGDGGLIFEFKIGGKIIYSNRETTKFLGKFSPTGKTAGNRFLGCYRDGHNRDLKEEIGSGMSLTRCMETAINMGMPYYALQYGTHCFVGNSYGRHGEIGIENCSMSCNANYNERCGGSWANAVFAVNQEPKVIEREKPGHVDSRFSSLSKYLWPTESGIWSLGRWNIEIQIPRFDTLPFCPDPDFEEFNPAGCSQPTDKNSCNAMPLANYNAELSKCFTKFDWNNFDKFYVTLNKLFEYIQISLGNPDHLKTLSKSSGVSSMIDQLKAKDRGNNYQSGSRYMADFIDSNYKLIVFLKMFAEKIKYPIDKTQLTDDGFVESNTPMYYNLIKHANKYDKPDPMKGIFKSIYRKLYLLARIIIGTPDIVKECDCLMASLDGHQKCTPCV